MALIAAYMHYHDKIEKAKPGLNGNKQSNAWKDFGRKKSVMRW